MYLHSKGALGSLEGPVRRELWSLATRRPLSRGDILFLGGQDDGGRVHLVRRGAVRLSERASDGREVAIGVGRPGDLLGLKPVLLGGTNDHDAIAVTNSVVYSFPARRTVESLLAHPATSGALAASICLMQRRAHSFIVERATGPVRSRLAGRLLQLATDADDGRDAAGIDGAVAHSDLGLLVGASRERVCVAMTDLRRAGVIDYGTKGLRIFKPDVLERLRCGARVSTPSRSAAAGDRQRSLPRQGI